MSGQQTYKIRNKNRRQLSTPLALSVGLLLGAALLVSAYFLFIHHPAVNALPPAIKKQLSFVVFYPSPDPAIVVDTKSFQYESKEKLINYVIHFDNKPVTISEQPTPQNIIDIPTYYDKLIETANVYASFNSYYDKVSLTRPKEFHGQQSAVMNSKGTLLFMHPTDGDLSLDQWKKLFNGLEIIR